MRRAGEADRMSTEIIYEKTETNLFGLRKVVWRKERQGVDIVTTKECYLFGLKYRTKSEWHYEGIIDIIKRAWSGGQYDM